MSVWARRSVPGSLPAATPGSPRVAGGESGSGPLLRRLELRANTYDQARLRNQARTGTVDGALARLDQLVNEDEVATNIRRNLTSKKQRYQTRLAFLNDNPTTHRSPGSEAAARARHDLIDAQREELLRWRDAGRLPDSSLRILQRELDHEEHTLPV